MSTTPNAQICPNCSRCVIQRENENASCIGHGMYLVQVQKYNDAKAIHSEALDYKYVSKARIEVWVSCAVVKAIVENSNFQEVLLKVVKILLRFGKLDDDAWIIYHTYSTQLFLGAEIKTCFNTKVLLPHGSDGKAYACNEGDLGLIPGLGRSPGEGNGNPLQCSCLENSMGRGAW